MADGDYIPEDGNTQTDQGTWLRHLSLGTKQQPHEPRSFDDVPMVHRTQTQMLQLAPGFLWCSCCANVRPKSYFDVVEWDMRGMITKWSRGRAAEWDGIPFPTKWHHECKQCVNMRDPKQRPVKFCSKCKQEKKRAEFSPDERNIDGLHSYCKDCRAKHTADTRANERMAVAV